MDEKKHTVEVCGPVPESLRAQLGLWGPWLPLAQNVSRETAVELAEAAENQGLRARCREM